MDLNKSDLQTIILGLNGLMEVESELQLQYPSECDDTHYDYLEYLRGKIIKQLEDKK